MRYRLENQMTWILDTFYFIFSVFFFTTPTAVSSFTVVIVFVFDQFWHAKQQICEMRILQENNNPIICLASILFANKFQGIDKKKTKIGKYQSNEIFLERVWWTKNTIQRVINLEYRTEIYFDGEHGFCAV